MSPDLRAFVVALALLTPGVVVAAGESLVGPWWRGPWSSSCPLNAPCSESAWRLASNGLTYPDVYVLQANPSDGTLYAGGAGGVFKSTDRGETWALSGFDMEVQNRADSVAGVRFGYSEHATSIVTSIAIDSANPQTLYAGTRVLGGAWYGQHRVFKSVDGGDTWTDSLSPALGGAANIQSLVIAPSDPATLYVADFSGGDGDDWSPLTRSTDGAANWTYVPVLSYQQVNVLAIDPVDPRTLYAGTFAFLSDYSDLPNGVLKSSDGGASWQPTGLTGAGISALAIAPRDGRMIYAATSSASSPEMRNRLFRSTDGGMSWMFGDTGLGDFSVTAIVVDPEDSNRIYAAAFGAGVARSLDGGRTWTGMNDGLVDLFVRTLLVVPGDSSTLYAGTRSGVFKLAH